MLPWCLLLSFLHNGIPCKHSSWAADNLAHLTLPFLAYISLTSPKVTLAFLFITCFLQKLNFIFYLEKNWSRQTVSVGPVKKVSVNKIGICIMI